MSSYGEMSPEEQKEVLQGHKQFQVEKYQKSEEELALRARFEEELKNDLYGRTPEDQEAMYRAWLKAEKLQDGRSL